MKIIILLIALMIQTNVFPTDRDLQMTQEELDQLVSMQAAVKNLSLLVYKMQLETFKLLEMSEKLPFYQLKKKEQIKLLHCKIMGANFINIKTSIEPTILVSPLGLNIIPREKLEHFQNGLHLFDFKHLAFKKCGDLKESLNALNETQRELIKFINIFDYEIVKLVTIEA